MRTGIARRHFQKTLETYKNDHWSKEKNIVYNSDTPRTASQLHKLPETREILKGSIINHTCMDNFH